MSYSTERGVVIDALDFRYYDYFSRKNLTKFKIKLDNGEEVWTTVHYEYGATFGFRFLDSYLPENKVSTLQDVLMVSGRQPYRYQSERDYSDMNNYKYIHTLQMYPTNMMYERIQFGNYQDQPRLLLKFGDYIEISKDYGNINVKLLKTIERRKVGNLVESFPRMYNKIQHMPEIKKVDSDYVSEMLRREKENDPEFPDIPDIKFEDEE